jgi:hypothetical protein
MAVLDFTSYEDIRAALGVSVDEIEDTTISLDLYDQNLTVEFESISLTLIDDYTALSESGPSGWTAAEKRFIRFTNLFATYAVAHHLTDSLPMFSPKEVTDGKAAQVRFALDPFKATIASVTRRYDQYRANLVEAYEAIQAGSAAAVTVRPYFVVSTPSSDPVTGT